MEERPMRVQVRFTEQEKEQVKKQANEAHLSMSSYIRQVVLDQEKKA